MNINDYVSELRGYLLALQRLCKTRCVFHSEVISIGSDINNTIDTYVNKLSDDFVYLGYETISYVEVEEMIRKYIISNLNVTDTNEIKLFEYDIMEYFGLCSTVVDPNGDFNQLISKGAIELKFNLKNYESCGYFVVPIDNFAVVVGLAIKRI